MLKNLLTINEMPKYLDVTDGLAAAVCHYFQKDIPEDESGAVNSWAAFMAKNPDRVKK